MTADGHETGLLKKCPRCGRLGVVAFNDDTKDFTIAWEGPPRNREGATRDVDMLVTLNLLLSPEFGCGYDGVRR